MDLVPETVFTNLFILFCNIKKRRNEDKEYSVIYFIYTTQYQMVRVVNAEFERKQPWSTTGIILAFT
jgi:hypothetical protein